MSAVLTLVAGVVAGGAVMTVVTRAVPRPTRLVAAVVAAPAGVVAVAREPWWVSVGGAVLLVVFAVLAAVGDPGALRTALTADVRPQDGRGCESCGRGGDLEPVRFGDDVEFLVCARCAGPVSTPAVEVGVAAVSDAEAVGVLPGPVPVRALPAGGGVS